MTKEDIQEYLDCNGFEALTHVDGNKYYDEKTVISIALEVVKNCCIPVVRRSLSWDDLQAGDKIIFDKVMSKYLTEGKEYTVTRVDRSWKDWCNSWFEIKDDRGNRKALRKHPKGYIVRMA